ncbi:sugar transferase (PEP-CTERM/EpsH1 system associated) [Undibacterium sp. GrIS 1.8]|uniref:TIGR03087 family PEP-CTERM/XrtA system glycosyltransferase n=1 Tax=unclassified Undibacterium TaxID=2630295 RepID=UPI003399EE96
MEHILLLVHRIPYPPNKGDKIRSYHLLKHLTKRYQVHLGTFVDDPDDWQYVDIVKQWCGETYFGKLNPVKAKLRSLGALISNRALSLDYYRDADLSAWVAQLMAEKSIGRVLIFSSAMAQYVEYASEARRVIDFVDIDSDKWLQYAEKKLWPMNWIYRREGRQLLRYEKKIAQNFDASLFVSAAEASLFKQLAPESKHKIGFFSNGVDTEYFSPAPDYLNPYPQGQAVIVFTGAMDYWPNIDAVQWFAEDILPSIRAKNPAACFYIVGSRPSDQVQLLARLPGVYVTGTVADVRPYIAHAGVSVAPLRIARGIQNKVLEAMAMAKTVVVSPQALEGIHAIPNQELIVAEISEQFISAISALLAKPDGLLGPAARHKVEQEYGWSSNLAMLDTLLDATPSVLSEIATKEAS